MQSSYVIDNNQVMDKLLNMITKFYKDTEKLNTYNNTVTLIKLSIALYICYMFTGILFIILSFFPSINMYCKDVFKVSIIKEGIYISIIGLILLITAMFTLYGLLKWKRCLLIPCLILYMGCIVGFVSLSGIRLYKYGMLTNYTESLIVAVGFLIIWGSIYVQYNNMKMPKYIKKTYKDLVKEIYSVSVEHIIMGKLLEDLPPKYEDIM